MCTLLLTKSCPGSTPNCWMLWSLCPKVWKANRFLLWKAHQPDSPPHKMSLCTLSYFLGTFQNFFFTSLTLEAKRGFKTFCFTSERWLQTQPVLAGRGKAESAPVRTKKQVTWIKQCTILEVWSVSADWQSSVNLSSQGTWSGALVQLACQPHWCQRLSSVPITSKMLCCLLCPKLHPSLWRRGVSVAWVQRKRPDVFGKAEA